VLIASGQGSFNAALAGSSRKKTLRCREPRI
jgi:hypothetical protein